MLNRLTFPAMLDGVDNLINLPLNWSRLIPTDPIPRHGGEVVFGPASRFGLTEREIWALAGLVRKQQPRLAFEFGTRFGTSALLISANAPAEAKVHTIDVNNGIANYLLFHPQQAGRIIVHHADTTEFDFEPYRDKVDLVFIDAAHDRFHVVVDTHTAFEIIKPGGLIIWHDYNVQHPGVFGVIRDLARNGSKIRRIYRTRLAYLEVD